MERILIQSDWEDLLNEHNGDEYFWVQYKFSTEPAINGKLRFNFRNDDSSLTSSNQNLFSIRSFSKEKKTIEITYSPLNTEKPPFTRKFVAPSQKFSLHLNKKSQKRQAVYSLDVTDGGLGVSASTDGSLLVWLTENGQIRRFLDGHINDVNVCKFFPSGLVVLSGGSDIRLKVWSAENGSNPVTLVGHTSGISDICFVNRGKRIISVGRDGQCKLFSVGESRCEATLTKYNCVINGCCIQAISDSNLKYFDGESTKAEDENDAELSNKLVALGCEDGFLRLISLATKKQIFEFNCESAVNCCCFLNETTVCCGTQNGYIFIYDLIGKTLNSWKEFRSSILSISSIGSASGFIATTADGSCFTWNLNASNSVVELTGSDCDPVYKVALNQTHVFTCCRDGLIRKYDLKNLFE